MKTGWKYATVRKKTARGVQETTRRLEIKTGSDPVCQAKEFGLYLEGN